MIAVLIVDHGSRRAEANAQLEKVAELVQGFAGPGVLVRAAHMELSGPDVGAAFAECVAAGATEVVVHPYMLAPGRHASTDLPALVAAAAARHEGVRSRVTPPLGLHPLLARVVLERCGLPVNAPPGARPDEGGGT